MTHIHNAILGHFRRNVTNHGVKAVAAAVQRMDGKAAEFWAEIDLRHGDARAALEHWTNVRHEIVHPGRTPRVRRPDARWFIELVRHIVAALDTYAVAARR